MGKIISKSRFYINILKSAFLLIIIGLLTNCSLFSSNNKLVPEINIEVKQIITDLDHLILDTDGNVWAWGSNSTGLSGDKPKRLNSNPTTIDSLNDISAIDCMIGVAFAADEEGNIWYWGFPLLWVIPYDSLVSHPVIISNQDNVKQINIISSKIYLLKNDGMVSYLEWDPYHPTHYIEPVAVTGLSNIKQLSGYLALQDDGTLVEIPLYDYRNPDCGSLDSSLNDIIMIQNYPMSHSLALTNDSTILSWGKNKVGVLGDGTFNDNPIPTKIDSLVNIISLSTEGARCLALNDEGIVWYWGLIDTDYDKDIHEYLPTPTIIEEFNDIKMIKAGGGSSSILIRENGSCWEFDFSTGECTEIFK